MGGVVTGPVEWLEQALKTAEDDARYTEDGSVFFDVSDDAVMDRYRRAGSPEAVLRLVAGARQILAEHADAGTRECSICAPVDWDAEESPGWYRYPIRYPCRTVRLLAEAWGWENG